MGRKEDKNNRRFMNIEKDIKEIKNIIGSHEDKFKKVEKDNIDTRIIALASMVSSSGNSLHTYRNIADQTGASESYVGKVVRNNIGNRK